MTAQHGALAHWRIGALARWRGGAVAPWRGGASRIARSGGVGRIAIAMAHRHPAGDLGMEFV
ncbi:hypothetical protein [Bordetella sp. LUAb4]|uniref:hypothetical protein n=1 Tax=Bordetella sp. LUAb4 TaxID=2843195 RepID=UPI001E48A45E|nr:hypothetical protein [Bordetella sp. LUAb4]